MPNDAISREAQDVPKRPPMLLAKVDGLDKWMMRGDLYWVVDDICSPYLSRELQGVNRDHSDPEAVRLYDQDIAEAQD